MWGCLQTEIAGAAGKQIGDGPQNSRDMLDAGCGVSSAAGLATAYTGGGQTDWYLPAINELEQLIKTIRAVDPQGNTYRVRDYWSSSQNGESTAWGIYALAGAQHLSVNKGFSFRVHAIRRY